MKEPKKTKTRLKNEEKLKVYIEHKFSNSSDKSSGVKPQAN